ncbi:MAG: hypothetical protein DRP91_01980 [Candidatus Neomarinimicrobiota bacterium]|nr:hypothetical protein [Candidatus Neomarinimicrobiota bacterium]RKY50339.1 MAG: hypothetical protein DRP91_01980 [Candidatus Neomarinimicrobiota bacterium]
MGKKDSFGEIIDKIEEMRDFFRIGDEIVPFLKDLFRFVRDIIPLLTEATTSISDTRNKIPDATERIIDVNQTTEMATQEILDRLEKISSMVDSLGLSDDPDSAGKVEKIKDELMNITYALQFQDITSQKLEHAKKILSAIHEKFTDLFEKIGGVKVKTKVGRKVISAIHQEMEKEELQAKSKEFREKTEDEVRHTTISQEDIDNLFKSGAI